MASDVLTCELCGTAVRVVGRTTMHYEPLASPERLEEENSMSERQKLLDEIDRLRAMMENDPTWQARVAEIHDELGAEKIRSEIWRQRAKKVSPERLAAVRAEVEWAREHASYLELGSDDPDQDRDNIATRDIIEAALARALVTLDALLAALQ